MPEYRVVVSHLHHNGGQKIEEVQVKNLLFTHNLNAAGAISFTIPIHDPKCTQDIFDPGARELRVYRDDVLKWGGYLWTAQREGEGEGEVTGSGTVNMRFGGETWISRLKRRRLKSDKTYTNWDIYDIAWDYISYTQQRPQGDLGITRGSLALRGVLQTIEWKAHERKVILDILQQLGESDEGYDFEVTPEKVWNTYERQGNDVPIVFELGLDKKNNIQNYTYMVDAISSGLSTELDIAGKGEAEAKKFSTRSDATQRAKYGLLEDVLNYRDIDDQGTLDSMCELLLRLYKAPREDITTYVKTVDPDLGTYGIGDAATVRIFDGYTQIERDLRLKSMTTIVPNVRDETLGLFYDEVYV